jgi:hypothetical protein
MPERRWDLTLRRDWAESTLKSDWCDRTEPRLWFDSAENRLIAEAKDPMDAKEKALPIDRKDPTLPIDKKDPTLPIESTEPVDRMDMIDRRAPGWVGVIGVPCRPSDAVDLRAPRFTAIRIDGAGPPRLAHS